MLALRVVLKSNLTRNNDTYIPIEKVPCEKKYNKTYLYVGV